MNKNEITPEKLAKMIDQTLLKPYVTLDDLREHCEILKPLRSIMHQFHFVKKFWKVLMCSVMQQ